MSLHSAQETGEVTVPLQVAPCRWEFTRAEAVAGGGEEVQVEGQLRRSKGGAGGQAHSRVAPEVAICCATTTLETPC